MYGNKTALLITLYFKLKLAYNENENRAIGFSPIERGDEPQKVRNI